MRETAPKRRSDLLVTGSIGVALYNVMQLIDQWMIADRAALMAQLRLGLFLPFCLAALFMLYRRRLPDIMKEVWTAAAGLLAAILIAVGLVLSESPNYYKLFYQNINVLVMLYMITVIRLRFTTALIVLPVMVVVQLWAIGVSGTYPPLHAVMPKIYYAVVTGCLLLVSYHLEQIERGHFLQMAYARVLHDELAQHANTDPLTGLYNRRFLDTLAASEALMGSDKCFSALLIDVDHFKRLNDSQGHLIGDNCLVRVAEVVRREAEAYGNGWVIRFGGEELLMLTEGGDEALAAQTAERVRQEVMALSIAHPALGPGQVVTVSIGVATGSVETIRLGQLLTSADNALYEAKHRGRNRVCRASLLAERDATPGLTA